MKSLSLLMPAFLRLIQVDSQNTSKTQKSLSSLHFALSDQNKKNQTGINLPVVFAHAGKVNTRPVVLEIRLWYVASKLRHKI